MPGPEFFSAKRPQEFYAGRPTDAPRTRVRDIVMCVGPMDSPTDEFVRHPPIASPHAQRMGIYAPGPFALGRGVEITRLSRADADLVVSACTPRGHYFTPIRHVNQRYSLVKEVDPEEVDEHPYAWDRQDALWDALTLSRLIRDNNYGTEFAARITDFEDGEQTVMYALTGESKHVYRLRTSREWLDAEDARQLAGLLEAYWTNKPDSSSRVGRALWRVEWASWLGFADLAMTILVSGLESLLKTDEHGATKQFKTRAASLASELGIDGVDEEFCRDAYRARSDWIHGSHVRLYSSAVKQDQSEQTGEAEGPANDNERGWLERVALVQDVLRAAVRRCIEDRGFRSIFDDRGQIRARWPVSRG